MRDLSKLNTPKKEAPKEELQPVSQPMSKKKKIAVIAIVCLLAIGLGSKVINKHLKKKKLEEKQAQEELLINNKVNQNTEGAPTAENEYDDAQELSLDSNTPPKATAESISDEEPDSDKMTFTFYDNLKHETVTVDAVPASQRTQYKYTYIYQIASFKSMEEARGYVQKAESVGLEPKFEQVGNWIRMYIGPYDSKRATQVDIIKLQKVGINMGFTREMDKVEIKPTKDDASSNSENPTK